MTVYGEYHTSGSMAEVFRDETLSHQEHGFTGINYGLNGETTVIK